MASPSGNSDIWLSRLLFVALATGFVFLRLLPLGPASGGLPGPELMLCLTLAWVMRRPDATPVWLIALITLLADFIFMRPPGLWAGLVVLSSESLRFRAGRLRELPFWLEWFLATAAIVFVFGIHRAVLKILLIGTPSLVQDLLFMLFTIISYPAVAVLSQWCFGIRKPSAGDSSATGRRA